jgi:cyclophilin family peptidyl-prolyl cis-trans isomerase
VRRAALLAAVAALAGCGGGNDKPAPPAETPVATEQSATGCQVVDTSSMKPSAAKLSKPTEKLDPAKTYVAAVDTNCGTFEITLDAKRAPVTGGSFKYLADQKFYDDTLIHRIVPGFVFQGGDPTGKGDGGPGYTVVEPPPSSLKYTEGVVAMAKTATDPIGASGSQFFVATGPDAARLTPDYALLGKITSGEGVVRRIAEIQTDPRTDKPDEPVLVKSVRVTER